jgi:hypothetical protein
MYFNHISSFIGLAWTDLLLLNTSVENSPDLVPGSQSYAIEGPHLFLVKGDLSLVVPWVTFFEATLTA